MAHGQHAHTPHPIETAPLHDPADAWHDHTRDEKPQSAHSEVGNPLMVMGVGIGLFLVIVAAVVIVDSYYKWYSAQTLKQYEVARDPTDPAIEARAFKAGALTAQQSSQGSWVVIPAAGEVPAKAVAQIPLSRAAELVTAEYAARMGGVSGAPAIKPAAK